MSRKTLILCVAVLSAMILALGIAIAFLYSGSGSGSGKRKVELDGSESCLAAVPSDAVLVLCSSRADKACGGVLASFALPDSLYQGMERGDLASLRRRPMSVSLHYSGKLMPLYVFDVDGLSESAAENLSSRVASMGCHVQKQGDFLLVSESDALVKLASRHIEREISVADAPGFAEALKTVDGDVNIFMSHLHAKRLLAAVGDRNVTRHTSFMEHAAKWAAMDVSECGPEYYALLGSLIFEGDANEFMTVLKNSTPAAVRMGEVLPSYTISAVSLPLPDFGKYASAYKTYVDSRQGLHDLVAKQKSLGSKTGVTPEDFFKRLNVKEVARATFKVDGKTEAVNLICVGSKDADLIFSGNDIKSFRGYQPGIHSWAYQSYVSSVFGELFALKDESCFTFVNGWIVSGSSQAVAEYVERGAVNYSLNKYLSDAGKPDLLSARPAVALAYFSLTEDRDGASSCLKPAVSKMLSKAMESEYAPVVYAIGKDKSGLNTSLEIQGLSLKKSKAPEFERDTTVVVPAGPFKVMNSQTGKMNTFYQNAQKSICLRDENGKDLWGVPFGKPLCGTAHTLDYYANGKLQIIFASGSKVYLIDRLGRYVGGFPIDLGKDILLGPDVYDFAGVKRYNILVLHKDNTVEMYNLKGKKPEEWKGIAAPETVKSLPEALTLGGKTFWVVRTSIQTLIYPFYGGEPLTSFEGDSKIRPDSVVKALDGSSVEVSCYNGKTKTIKLK